MRPYLMANKFNIYIDHYSLQWLMPMRTGSVLLHRWSTALEEFDFTIHHWPGKDQGHVNGLSHLPIESATPKGEEATLFVQTLPSEEDSPASGPGASESHPCGGDALWKLFRDRFSYTGGRKKKCFEVARLCIQCQAGTDYGAMGKTAGTILSSGLWDTLSVDIVGPLPADRRMEYIITFVIATPNMQS